MWLQHQLTFQLNVSNQAQYYHVFNSLKKGWPGIYSQGMQGESKN